MLGGAPRTLGQGWGWDSAPSSAPGTPPRSGSSWGAQAWLPEDPAKCGTGSSSPSRPAPPGAFLPALFPCASQDASLDSLGASGPRFTAIADHPHHQVL